MDLHEKIRTIPTLPGCYLYKNAEGAVIYVGKAKNLRARVQVYSCPIQDARGGGH
jgi:excinuclease ABC subunit C